MPLVKLTPQVIAKWRPGINKVLKDAAKRAGRRNIFLSAYQILQLLSPGIRQQLLDKYGRGGKGAGNVPAATEIVMEVTRRIPDIEIMYMSSEFTGFEVEDNGSMHVMEPAGNEYFALYRIPSGFPNKSRSCKLPFGERSSMLPRPRPIKSRTRK